MSTPDLDTVGVYQVFTGGGTGSGFLIDRNLLLTNCHVTGQYRTVAVELRDRRRVLGTVRRVHPRRDLAIVELAQPLDGEILPLAAVDKLKPRQTVHIIGYPVGLPLSVSEGVISHPKQLLDGQFYVQTDAAINPGNSGGPMIDDDRQIVAVTTCKLATADMVGFGIPAADVRSFVAGFREQKAAFGVVCPACEALLEGAGRFCDGCGVDLEELELAAFYEPPEQHPLVTFVEGALARANIDPVLARHGQWHWSFYSGSAPIQIWCADEYICFASPLVQPGKQKLGELFRFLLSPEHKPFAFDLWENVVRLHLTFHVTDVFSQDQDEAADWIGKFLAGADHYDNALAEQFGCEPAPETQMTFFQEQAAK